MGWFVDHVLGPVTDRLEDAWARVADWTPPEPFDPAVHGWTETRVDHAARRDPAAAREAADLLGRYGALPEHLTREPMTLDPDPLVAEPGAYGWILDATTGEFRSATEAEYRERTAPADRGYDRSVDPGDVIGAGVPPNEMRDHIWKGTAMSRIGDRFSGFGRGPLERKAQARLDVTAQTGLVTSREEAERLSDDVWRARASDRGADKDHDQSDARQARDRADLARMDAIREADFARDRANGHIAGYGPGRARAADADQDDQDRRAGTELTAEQRQVLDAIRARDEQIIRDGGPADRFLDVDIYQVDASALRGEQADAARDRDETRGGVLGAALDRVYDPALGGERALTDREANEIARAEDRQALHPHHDDGDPRDGIERRLELAHAEAAQDRAERADPNTARMVEARDQQAAGGRFDDADSTQRLIDAVREQPAAHELQGRTQDAARTLSVDAHGALLRSAFGAAPVEHRAEPAEPPVRETEPEVREL